MADRRSEMHHCRYLLARMGLMARRKAAHLRQLVQDYGWLDPNPRVARQGCSGPKRSQPMPRPQASYQVQQFAAEVLVSHRTEHPRTTVCPGPRNGSRQTPTRAQAYHGRRRNGLPA